MEVVEGVIAIVGSGGISSALTLWANRRKSGAEGDNLIVEGATNILNGSQKVLASALQRLDVLEKSEAECRERGSILEARLVEQDSKIHSMRKLMQKHGVSVS